MLNELIYGYSVKLTKRGALESEHQMWDGTWTSTRQPPDNVYLLYTCIRFGRPHDNCPTDRSIQTYSKTHPYRAAFFPSEAKRALTPMLAW